jgi:hypothetical protein
VNWPSNPLAAGIADGRDGTAAAERNVWRFVAVACTLPLFAQSFYYLLPIAPLYYLSKVWPVIMLPAAAWALTRLQLQSRTIYVVWLAYALGLTPLISMMQLGAGFFDALTTTVKVWPFTYYFSLLGVLCWLRPTARLIERAVVALGVATFVLMAILWVLVPASWYTVDATNSKFFIYETERGNRIYMPMFFGYLLLFYLARRLSSRVRMVTGSMIVASFALLLWINKQRASIAGAALVVGITACPARWRRLAFIAGALVGLFAMAFALFGPSRGGVVDSFGNSLSVRQHSLMTAIEYLGDDPLRWLFGVGATTRFSSVTLADIFKSEQFYLADIGWVGVVFEFGVLGALLVAAVYGTGLVVTMRAGAAGDPFLQTLAGYVLFMIVTSAIYSVVFTPGELATVVAMSEYLARYAPGVPRPRAVSGFVALSPHGTR